MSSYPDTYQPPGRMDPGYGYQWDKNVEYGDKYPNGPLPEGVGSDPYEEKQTCCRRCVGHPKGVGIVLILIGGFAIIAQIVACVLGAYLSYLATGIWTGLVLIFTGAFGIAYNSKKTRRKLLIYTVLSHVSILLSLILMGICMGGVKQDWELTDGCGGYSWRRWFDSDCVEGKPSYIGILPVYLRMALIFTDFQQEAGLSYVNCWKAPQAKIGLHFTLVSCGLAGIILSIYTSVGCCYEMGWCGKDRGIKKESIRVPYVWTNSLQRNGSLPRQNSSPVKPIYTGNQTAARKPRKPSSSSQKSQDFPDSEKKLLGPQDFHPREIPPQQYIIPYVNQEQYPDYEDEPFTPQPYMQHSTPTTRVPPMESDF